DDVVAGRVDLAGDDGVEVLVPELHLQPALGGDVGGEVVLDAAVDLVWVGLRLRRAPAVGPGQAGDDAQHPGLDRLAVHRAGAGRGGRAGGGRRRRVVVVVPAGAEQQRDRCQAD